MDRLKLFAGLMALLFASVSLLSGQLRDQVTVDATRQLAPPMRGRGPFPGSATPGHSADLPIRLDLLIPTGELTPDGTVLIDFRITNIGSELITLPVSIDQGSFLPQPPDTDFTLDILTLWLTGPEAIEEEYLAGYLGDPKYGRLYKSESPLTSAELYGRSDNPQSFHALAPNQSLVVHASSRVGLKAGIHSLTAHAELAREFIGSNNTSPPSRHQTGKLIGTADSESQIKMLSTAKPQNGIVPQAQQQKLSAISQNSVVWITREQQEAILQRVRGVPGWTITNSNLDRTPDDWYTLDHRGFEIEGKKGGYAFHIWFLPKDWLGIRQFRPNRSFSVYWEGVLADSEYKTITESDDRDVHEAVQQIGMHTPSLVNSGWAEAQTVFKGRLQEVDDRTQALVDEFCRDRFCREEAAYSLIVLGVPSNGITLDCAEHATGKAQEFCVSALGYWGGVDSVRILNAIVSDPASSPQVQKYAAIALEGIADPSSASALIKSLSTTSSSEAAVQAAEALARIHYKAAAPLVLSRLRTEQNSFFQALYAGALASLQYKPATPFIEELCQTTKLSADRILQEQRDTYLGWLPEIALMRLTAPWGTPSNGIRLLLLAPANSVLPGRIQVAVVIENVGDQDLAILGTPGDVIVDGKTYDHKDPAIVDGNVTLRVNDVAVHAIDLTDLITNPGIHRVEYRRGTTISNELTLQILNR